MRRLKEEVRKKDFNINLMGTVATPGLANPDSVLAMKDEEQLTRGQIGRSRWQSAFCAIELRNECGLITSS